MMSAVDCPALGKIGRRGTVTTSQRALFDRRVRKVDVESDAGGTVGIQSVALRKGLDDPVPHDASGLLRGIRKPHRVDLDKHILVVGV